MSIREWFWSWLPDECEIDDCCRQGMAGNENHIFPFPETPDFHIVVCDYCNSKYESGEVLLVKGITSRMIVKEGAKLVDFNYRRRKNATDKSAAG